jgi:hypothetical protein
MRLNPYLKEELVSELKSATKRMKEEADPSKKLFYFSAAYGMTNRVLRFDFSEELLLVDALLTITYNAVNTRLQIYLSGDRTIPITPEILDGLAECIDDLASAIDKDKPCYEILMRIITLSFLTTGPGHYMAIKGQVKMPKKRSSK